MAYKQLKEDNTNKTPKPYIVIRSVFVDEFEKKVETAMNNGYQLYGNPFHVISKTDTLMCQTLILKKEEKK
jgi:hypothetical protein